MKTVLARGGSIIIEDRPKPQPGPGQVLVKTRACGICGSDLHLLNHAEELKAVADRLGAPPSADDDRGVPLGHEFIAEIVEYGPQTSGKLPRGTRVCSLPFLLTEAGAKGIGVDPELPGAYSEYFLLSETLMIPIADDLPDEAAALVEPLAVGIHAVARAGRGADQVALVVGCGPIGLATITALRLQGVETILAVDPLAGRRELASHMGATEVLDPTAGDEHARLAELAGGKPTVVYECVGRPWIVAQLIEKAPQKSRIVFVGLCTEEVAILPFIAMSKELDLMFAFYYSPEDFQAAVDAITAGGVDWKLWVTGKVGIDGIAAACQTLSGPNDHVKVLVEPWRNGDLAAP